MSSTCTKQVKLRKLPKFPFLRQCIALVLVLALVGGVNYLVLGRVELCPCRMLFGVPCPGCGLTHSTLCLLHGRFLDSLAYCPLTVFLLLTFGACALLRLSPKVHLAVRFLACSRIWHASLAAAFVVLYVTRMLLYFPDGPYPMVYSSRNYMSLSRHILSKVLNAR